MSIAPSNVLADKRVASDLNTGAAVLLSPTHASPNPLTNPVPGRAGLIEVCGHGKLDDDQLQALMRRAEKDVGLVINRAAVTLIDSNTENDMAIGLWARVKQAELSATQPFREHSGCVTSQDCWQRLLNAQNGAREVNVAPLVVFAERSRDPATYALAVSACAGRRDGVCASINPSGWAARDPDNAIPLLLMAAELPAGDIAGRARLLIEAAARRQYQRHMPDVERLLQTPIAASIDDLQKRAFWGNSYTFNFEMDSRMFEPIGAYCGRRGLGIVDREAVCGQLAGMLSARGSNYIDLDMAGVAASAAGWSKEKRNQIEAEKNEVMQVMLRDTPVDSLGCEAVVRNNRFASDTFRVGELAASRLAKQR